MDEVFTGEAKPTNIFVVLHKGSVTKLMTCAGRQTLPPVEGKKCINAEKKQTVLENPELLKTKCYFKSIKDIILKA